MPWSTPTACSAPHLKYPDYLDICIALTGRAQRQPPDEGRHASLLIEVETPQQADDSFWPLLGTRRPAGRHRDIPVLCGLETQRRRQRRASRPSAPPSPPRRRPCSISPGSPRSPGRGQRPRRPGAQANAAAGEHRRPAGQLVGAQQRRLGRVGWWRWATCTARPPTGRLARMPARRPPAPPGHRPGGDLRPRHTRTGGGPGMWPRWSAWRAPDHRYLLVHARRAGRHRQAAAP